MCKFSCDGGEALGTMSPASFLSKTGTLSISEPVLHTIELLPGRTPFWTAAFSLIGRTASQESVATSTGGTSSPKELIVSLDTD